jgi:hypothetical protein
VGILLFDLAMEIALTSMLYHAGNRSFQDEFGSRRALGAALIIGMLVAIDHNLRKLK